MAFSYNGRNLPYLSTYKEAVEFWETAYKWRDAIDVLDARVLDSRAKKFVTIRKTSNDAVCCRMHHTDVVTYNPDGTILLRTYRSVSTDEFANRLLRGTNVTVAFNSGPVVQVGDKFFRAGNTPMVLRIEDNGEYRVASETQPFEFATINLDRAKDRREQYDYKAFAAWAGMMYAAMQPDCGLWHGGDAAKVLPHRDQWPTLLRPL